MIIADNLKIHTAVGSLLVRRMLTELSDQLYLVYTPAYDPDANRIEWLWRISRRVVTHNHQRRDFETLLNDVRTHFETLTQLLMTCFVISAVLLRQTSDPIDHRQLPHNPLEAPHSEMLTEEEQMTFSHIA